MLFPLLTTSVRLLADTAPECWKAWQDLVQNFISAAVNLSLSDRFKGLCPWRIGEEVIQPQTPVRRQDQHLKGETVEVHIKNVKFQHLALITSCLWGEWKDFPQSEVFTLRMDNFLKDALAWTDLGLPGASSWALWWVRQDAHIASSDLWT